MIHYAAITDIGVRTRNEDRIMIDGKVISDGTVDGVVDSSVIAVVCDGVGGYPHGDKAAEITTRTFVALAGVPLNYYRIEEAISEANRAVIVEQASDTEHSKMASTIAGIYVSDSTYITFNVGDSKIYRYRKPYLMQLSENHSVGNALLNYIGSESQCKPSVQIGENRVLVGDIYLVCSDGLSGVVSVDDIEQILFEPNELAEKCRGLMELSIRNNSQDNISIVLLEVA
jgi:protein phosphatase